MTMELTCWSIYALSNAQEWPIWIEVSDFGFEVVHDERIGRSRAENSGPPLSHA